MTNTMRHYMTLCETTVPQLRVSRYSKQQMIERGADGHLDHGYERYIPINDIDGLEPEPSNNEEHDGVYRPGRIITQPIETTYNHDNNNYMLYAGNHRLAQAKANGQTHIKAFVQSDNFKVGKQARLDNPD